MSTPVINTSTLTKRRVMYTPLIAKFVSQGSPTTTPAAHAIATVSNVAAKMALASPALAPATAAPHAVSPTAARAFLNQQNADASNLFDQLFGIGSANAAKATETSPQPAGDMTPMTAISQGDMHPAAQDDSAGGAPPTVVHAEEVIHYYVTYYAALRAKAG